MDDDRILKVLEKLEEAKRKGLISEEFYQEKRRILLLKYLELDEAESSGEIKIASHVPSASDQMIKLKMIKKGIISKSGYLILGIISAIIALFILPPVFGAISIVCGIQLFRKFDEGLGLAICILGGVCLSIGVVLGILSMM